MKKMKHEWMDINKEEGRVDDMTDITIYFYITRRHRHLEFT